MENIFIILLFIAPGLALNAYSKITRIIVKRENSSATVYEQLFGIVVHSVIVTALTILIYRKWCVFVNAIPPEGFEELINELYNFVGLAVYIGICIVLTIIWGIVYYVLRKPIFWLRKHMIKRTNSIMIEHIDEPTVWENVFLSKEANEKRKIISIYCNGQFVTAGESYGVNTGKDERRELRLLNTDTICELLKEDEAKEDSEKLFRNIEFEYFDADTGLLIKFHDPSELEKHWETL